MTHQSKKKQKKMVDQPRKEVYYKSRIRLIDWLRNECVQLELSHETYANSLFLMDYFWKIEKFNSAQFLKIALCMMVIASKLNETKILYTSRMAKNNKIDEEEMRQEEVKLIEWFKFRTDCYNFARIIGQYMRRWDEELERRKVNEFRFMGNEI